MADLTAAFLRGEKDNYQLDAALNEFDDPAADEALHAVRWQVWLHYDDCSRHRVRLDEQGWHVMRRWIAFLGTGYGLRVLEFPLPTFRWVGPVAFLLAAGLGVLCAVAMDPLALVPFWLVVGVLSIAFARFRYTRVRRAFYRNTALQDREKWAPFLSEEDWQAHERLTERFDLPAYDPAVHDQPIRGRAGEAYAATQGFLSLLMVWPLAMLLDALLTDAVHKTYVRTDAHTEALAEE